MLNAVNSYVVLAKEGTPLGLTYQTTEHGQREGRAGERRVAFLVVLLRSARGAGRRRQSDAPGSGRSVSAEGGYISFRILPDGGSKQSCARPTGAAVILRETCSGMPAVCTPSHRNLFVCDAAGPAFGGVEGSLGLECKGTSFCPWCPGHASSPGESWQQGWRSGLRRLCGRIGGLYSAHQRSIVSPQGRGIQHRQRHCRIQRRGKPCDFHVHRGQSSSFPLRGQRCLCSRDRQEA